LITGNSHGGALRLAWTAMTDRPDGLEVDFLNIAAKYFALFTTSPDGRFGLLDETLAPENALPDERRINGALSVDLRLYTHVLIAGCHLGSTAILRMLATHRVDLIREQPAGLPRLSQAAFTAFTRDIALKRLPMARIAGLAPWCKVGLSMAPRMSERALSDPGAEPFLKALHADPTGLRAALALTDTALDREITAQGARLFPVPSESLAASGLTKAVYSITTTQGDYDHEHMNAVYGAMCLGPILEWVLA
jgi:hypothetical protein